MSTLLTIPLEVPGPQGLCPSSPPPHTTPETSPVTCFLPGLQQLMRHAKAGARARQQAQEHEAERLRIGIVTLREALDEEPAAEASLEGQLRVQREETGERESASHPTPSPGGQLP